ncbi:MAG: ATP-dependent DNA helicase RecG [Kiritimatiellia bacterium]
MPADFKTGLETPVQFIRGVGPSRAALLSRMGITTAGELLYCLPRRYEDRSEQSGVRDLRIGEPCDIEGTVLMSAWVTPKGRKATFDALLKDDAERPFKCKWYGASYLKDQLAKGKVLRIHGKPVRQSGEWVFYHPEFEITDDGEEESIHHGRVVPVYPLTESLPQRTLRRILWNTVGQYGAMAADLLPEETRRRFGFGTLADCLKQVHFPETVEQGNAGRRRLVFEEFLSIQLGVLDRKKKVERLRKAHRHTAPGELRKKFEDSLGFALTNAQRRCTGQILRDMAAAYPMHRLLQGDVGSGKTVVAAMAALQAVEGGAQSAILAPTEVLSRQHFLGLGSHLTRMGVECALITSDMTPADRRLALSGLRTGRVQVAVGTHALLFEEVQFRRLGLVVIDEQHKFGVDQRLALYAKGEHPDVLVMSATPIPRTLAMTLYGDLEVSIIDELPAGRREIQTRVIGEDKLPAAYDFIRKQVAKGRQAFLVYPMVNESENEEFKDIKSAEVMFERLRNGEFKGLRLGLLHGKMAAEEKHRVMRVFRAGDLDVLVATTVIEVGVDIPNATVMLVENAERFGLAQLHQLRGRIGRGEHKSFCVLQGVVKSRDAWQRLKIMEETRDGFRIAEEDLKIRGMGNLVGREQSGFPAMQLGDPAADTDLLIAARDEAARLLEADPEGVLGDHVALFAKARRIYSKIGVYATVG